MSRHMQQHDNHVLINLKEDQNNYERLAETGKIIEEHVEREDINPNSLRKDYILALDVHHNENQSQDDKLTSLNPWQSKLLGLMEPSDRQILWIRGIVGNDKHEVHPSLQLSVGNIGVYFLENLWVCPGSVLAS